MDYYVGSNMYSDDALQHHGIIGQKWGVRRTPEQLGYRGARHVKVKNISRKEERQNRKSQKIKAKKALIEAKAAKNKKAAEEKEKEKLLTKTQKIEKAVNSGNADKILEVSHLMTTQELQNALARLNVNAQLSKIAKDSKKTANQKIEAFNKIVGNLSTAVIKGSELYNGIAKILNSVGNEDLPIIGEKKPGKEKLTSLDKIIRSGDAKKILKNAGKFNDKQMEEIAKRIGTLQKLEKRISELEDENED